MALRLVLFDLLGTLIREEGGWEALDGVMEETARRFGLREAPRDLSGRFSLALLEILRAEPEPASEGGPSAFTSYEEAAKGVFAGLLASLGFTASPADVAWFWSRFSELQRRAWRPFAEVDRVLDDLRARGLRLAVVTDAGRPVAAMVAEALGLGRRIEFIQTAEEAGYVKPDPRLFRAALARARVAPDEAAMVGDSYERDLVGAREAGIQTLVLVDRHDARTVEVPRIRDLKDLPRLLARASVPTDSSGGRRAAQRSASPPIDHDEEPVALDHELRGPAGGLPVLLVHGFALDRRMWRHQVGPLVAAGYRVVLPDLRGHGRSPAPEVPSTMDRHVADLVALLEMLQLAPVVLAGFSMGGYVALEFVRRHPGRVRALVLADTRAEPDGEEARRRRAETAQSLREEGMPALESGFLPKLLTARTRERDPGRAEEVRRMVLECPPRGAAQASLGMAERPDQRPHLAAIRVPTLVVVGTEDALTPPEASRAMADAIAGARLVVLPGAAHLAPMEAPDAFNAALLAWMSDSGLR